MKIYVQLMIILFFSLIGEFVSNAFKLPIPGSIIGMLLLFIALYLKWIRLRHVSQVAYFLLANMTILFLPAGVGVMQYFNVLLPNLLPFVLILFGAIVLNIVTISFVVGFIKRRYEGNNEMEDRNHA